MPAAPRRSTARAPACPWRWWSRARPPRPRSPRRMLAGAHVFTVDGTIATAGKLIARVAPRIGWFDLATLKEPYRLEGKKTMGLELAEQLGWETPDMLDLPDGRRHRSRRHLEGVRRAGRARVDQGQRSRASSPSRPRAARPWSRRGTDRRETSRRCGRTRSPMRRACACPAPSPAGRCSRSSATPAATAAAVSEREIVDAQRLLARLEGIWTSPEGAANVAALIQMKDAGVVAADTRVVIDLHRLRHQESRRPRCPRRSTWRAAKRHPGRGAPGHRRLSRAVKRIRWIAPAACSTIDARVPSRRAPQRGSEERG